MVDQIKVLLANAFEKFDSEEWDTAEDLYRKGMQLADGKDERLLNNCIHGLAFTLALKGNFQEAHLLYKKLLKDAQNNQDISEEAIALHQIGMVYRMEKKFNRAIEIFTEEKQLREEKLPNDFVGFSANAYELGIIALEMEEFEQTISYLTKALENGCLANDPICMACAHRGMGEYYQRSGNVYESKIHFQQSIELFEQSGDERGVASVRLLIN